MGEYAKQHGYDYEVFKQRTLLDRAAPWEKFAVARSQLQKYDYVMLIDADAFIFNMSQRIEDWMSIDADLHIGRDIGYSIDQWYESRSKGGRSWALNSGVMIFKKSNWIFSILDYMLSDPVFQPNYKVNRKETKNSRTDTGWDQAAIRYVLAQNISGAQTKVHVILSEDFQTNTRNFDSFTGY